MTATTPLEIDTNIWERTDGLATQSKVFRDGKGRILKYMKGGNPAKVQKEFSFLKTLSPSRYFPEPFEYGHDYILMEDVGERHLVTDIEIAMKHGLAVLAELRAAKIRHNDLRSLANVIVADNIPRIVDFGWSQWLEEEPTLRVYPDQALLVSLAQLYRLARRE